MICIISTSVVPLYTTKGGYDWFRQADAGTFNDGFEGTKWSHFFRRKYIWGPVGGFYPVLLCDALWGKQDRWARHPFEYNGRLWWHGGSEPIASLEEEFPDKLQRWAFTLFNWSYDRLKGPPSVRARAR